MNPKNLLTKLLLVLTLMCCGLAAMAQNLTVTGTVIDESGLPVIGAGVVQQGTTNGTATDVDGKFSITVPKGATLVVSSIGYTTQNVVADRQLIEVILPEDTQMIEETIVVGYGVQRKSDVTGSISKIEEDDMLNRSITSAQDALAGKTSGVQTLSTSGAPGSSATIRIRGYSSNYSSDPLYIVDGLKARNISSIDPNDIESIEILKDAASAAIYGAEAGNGVILVTTKKAAEGKTQVNYDFKYVVSNHGDIPEVMNAQEYIQYYKEGGLLTDTALNTFWDGKTDNNWYDDVTEPGAMMQNNLQFSTANSKSSLMISLNQMNHDGFLKGDLDSFNRYGITLNGEMKVKPWLTVGTNIRGSYSETKSIPGLNTTGTANGPFTTFVVMDPLTPTWYEDGDYPSYVQEWIDEGYSLPTFDGKILGITQFNTDGAGGTNPLTYLAVRKNEMSMTDVNGMFYANLTPVKGLVITSRFGTEISSSYTNSYSRVYWGGNSTRMNQDPTVETSSPKRMYWQWENFANYTHDIGEHTLTGMVGMSYSETHNNTLEGSVNNLLNTADNFAYTAYATADAVKTIEGDMLTTAKLSYFGRLDWAYKNRYNVQFTMRADAADLSVLSSKQRWGYFPAVSGGWTFSNEPWLAGLKRSKAFTYGKLRLSWGRNGSISNLSDYMWASAIASNSGYPFGDSASYTVGAQPSTLGNPDLKWETSEQIDFGIDLRFLRDRLTFTADYYRKKTKDLLLSGVVPSMTAGNDPSPINAGDVANNGLDLDLSWADSFGDFHYRISGNIAFLKNEVTYLDPTIDRIEGTDVIFEVPFTYFEQGYPLWYMRGYVYEGVDPATGDPTFKDVNGDGEFSGSDVEMIGSAIPDFTYGITLNLGWKNLDLVVFGSGSQGNDIFNNLNTMKSAMPNRMKMYYTDRWTESNTTAKYPRANSNNLTEFFASSANVFDGSYFKLRQIQIGYTVPKKILSIAGISRLRAYVSLDNYFTFTSYKGYDPETASRSVTNAMGIDSGSFPTAKNLVFGVNLSF